MKKVIMHGIFLARFEEPIDLATEKLSFEGFEVRTDKGDIPFDFDACSYDYEKVSDREYKITYQSGRGEFFNDSDVSEDFDEAYEKLCLTREDVTAKLLASASAVTEANITCSDENVDFTCEILSMTFTDESGTEYSVDESVLKNFTE